MWYRGRGGEGTWQFFPLTTDNRRPVLSRNNRRPTGLRRPSYTTGSVPPACYIFVFENSKFDAGERSRAPINKNRRQTKPIKCIIYPCLGWSHCPLVGFVRLVYNKHFAPPQSTRGPCYRSDAVSVLPCGRALSALPSPPRWSAARVCSLWFFSTVSRFLFYFVSFWSFTDGYRRRRNVRRIGLRRNK